MTKGDEVVFNCPVCKHPKPKLSVNLVTDWVHCWICDKELSGKTLVPVLRLKGKSEDYRAYIADMNSRNGKVVSDVKYDVPRLPKEFRSLSRDWKSPYYRAAISYLLNRGFTMRDILVYKLGYCEEGDYKNRIIIPSFDQNGELNFSIGRAFYEGMELPYKHEKLSKDVVWNEYLIDWDRPLTVTEGQFDAMTSGENTTALQGSILKERSKLFNKIVEAGVDVYFAMDTDAFRKQLNIIELFLSYGVKSYYVNLGKAKDINMMGKKAFQEARGNSRRVRSKIDIMKMRLGA